MIRTLYTSSTTNNCTSYSRIVSFGIQKKKSRDRLFLLSIIITSRRPLVCNRLSLSLSLSLARIRSARSRNSVEPTTLPPPPPISRVISSSSTIALESHCSTSILQSNLPPLPVPWALQTPNLLFRNRIRDRDGTRSSSSIPRGGYEGKLRIPGESSASIGVRTNGNELTFCQDARWSLSNRNSLIHCDAPIYLFCGELSIYGLREGKWISKAGLNMAVVFARFCRRSWNSCFVFIRSFYNICN